MIRPRSSLLLPLAAVLLAAGCGTVGGNDVVARYGDAELTTDELAELTVALAPPGADDRGLTDGAVAREGISTWIRIEAVTAVLEQDGTQLSDVQLDEATTQMAELLSRFGELSDGMRDFLVEAQAAFTVFGELPPPSEDELREFYDLGPERSGITCVAHILVETEADADDVVAELDAGTDFASLATERSIDPGSAAAGGVIDCTSTDQFAAIFVEPFVEAALAAQIGVPTAPVESDFGYHVVLVRPFEQAQAEIESFYLPPDFALARAYDRADVSVDPRYGTFSRGRVVPLS